VRLDRPATSQNVTTGRRMHKGERLGRERKERGEWK
jgi:hypothetical protein